MKNKSKPSQKVFMQYVRRNDVRDNQYYEKAYHKIVEQDKSFCWNLDAAIFGSLWLLDRRMYLYALVYWWGLVVLFYIGVYFLSFLDHYHLTLPVSFPTLCFITSTIIFGCFGTKIYCKWMVHNIKNGLKIPENNVDQLSILFVIIMIVLFPFAVDFIAKNLFSPDFLFRNYYNSDTMQWVREASGLIISNIYLLLRHFMYYHR